ncbi:MAG: hypothetical protein ACXWMS_11140 [Syntrophales bacterium]
MVAYEFYCLNPTGGYQIIGVLPERRKNPARITQQSIINWGEKMFGKELGDKDIFFIQVTMDEKTSDIFRPILYTITQKEI